MQTDPVKFETKKGKRTDGMTWINGLTSVFMSFSVVLYVVSF